MKSNTFSPLVTPSLVILGIVGLLFLITTYQSFLVPLVLATFFALLILPGAEYLDKKHVPKILNHLIMVALLIIIISSILFVISFAFAEFASSLGQYRPIMENNIMNLQAFLQPVTGGILANPIALIGESGSIEFFLKNASSILVNAGKFGATTGLVITYTFFLLHYREHIKNTLGSIIQKKNSLVTSGVIKKIERMVPRYLGGLFLANIMLGIITYVGLLIAGVDNALFWGVAIGLLNTVPYIGPLVGFSTLVVIAFLTQGFPVMIGALIVFAIGQFIDNAILAPYITGGSIDINPLVAIIGLVAMGTIWGVIGMILAIPLIGIVKIICDTIPDYQPIGQFLGNDYFTTKKTSLLKTLIK
jgi:predicted PurR-regulated permease PerM